MDSSKYFVGVKCLFSNSSNVFRTNKINREGIAKNFGFIRDLNPYQSHIILFYTTSFSGFGLT